MPTAYTAPVENGEITELPDFILRCTRAMGVCISQREDPLSDLPPRQFKAWHTEEEIRAEIAEAEVDLERATMLTLDQAEIIAEQEYDQALDSYRKWAETFAVENGRYESMIEQVTAWQCPERLQGLKDFMLQQLEASKPYRRDEPKRLTAGEVRGTLIDMAKRILKLRYEDLERVQAAVADGQAFLDAVWSEVDRMRADG